MNIYIPPIKYQYSLNTCKTGCKQSVQQLQVVQWINNDNYIFLLKMQYCKEHFWDFKGKNDSLKKSAKKLKKDNSDNEIIDSMVLLWLSSIFSFQKYVPNQQVSL